MINGMRDLNDNVDDVETQINKLVDSSGTGPLKNLYDKGTAFLQAISQIPTGVAGG